MTVAQLLTGVRVVHEDLELAKNDTVRHLAARTLLDNVTQALMASADREQVARITMDTIAARIGGTRSVDCTSAGLLEPAPRVVPPSLPAGVEPASPRSNVRSSRELAHPLCVPGQKIGLIVVERLSGGLAFDAKERALLTEIARRDRPPRSPAGLSSPS